MVFKYFILLLLYDQILKDIGINKRTSSTPVNESVDFCTSVQNYFPVTC